MTIRSIRPVVPLAAFLPVALLQSAFSQGFTEGLNNSATNVSVTGGTYYSGSSATGDRPALAPFYSEGTHSYGRSNGTATITSNAINSLGASGVSVSFRLASFSIDSTGNGADATDQVTLAISPDGGGAWYDTLRVAGNGNAYWSFSSGTGIASANYDGDTSPTLFAPAGGGARTTDGYSTMTVGNLPQSANLRFRITMVNNSANERWLVDQIILSGTFVSPPTVTTGAATSPAESSVTLTGEITATGGATVSSRGFEYSTTDGFANGTGSLSTESGTFDPGTYTRGVTGLTANTVYYYKAVAANVAGSAYGSQASFTTVPSAPTITSLTPGNGKLTVFFTPGAGGPATIADYEYSTNGGASFASAGTTSSPFEITGLSNGTTYDVQLRAVNGGGTGSASTTVQGTPEIPSTPAIAASPTMLAAPLATTYGTASNSTSFLVSGVALTGNLTVAPPPGLEVSTSSGSGYATALNLAPTAGEVPLTTIHVRLAASAPVGGSYNNAVIAISGGGASPVNVTTSASGNSVSQKPVSITGITGANKVYDRTAAATVTGTATLVGVVEDDDAVLGGTPVFTFADVIVGTDKPVSASGYAISGSDAGNYLLSQPSGLTANITAKELTVTGATVVTRPYDGTTAATITGGELQGVIEGDAVSLSGGGTFATAGVGEGIAVTASLALAGSDAGNYSLVQPTGLTGSITKADQTITFAALPPRTTLDAPFALTGTASSGLALTYVSSNPDVATVAGSTLTIVGVGTSTITASQPGDSNYNAATPVERELVVNTAPLTAWEVNGLTSYGPSPFTATTVNPNITAGGLSRGPGVTTTGSAGSNAWGGNGFTSSSLPAAVTSNDFATFSIGPNTGYSMSLSQIAAYNIRRSGTGPITGQWQYQIGSGTYQDIGTPITWGGTTSATGNPQAAIDLSGISALQNIPAGTTVTFRIVNWGGSDANGTWYINNIAGNDLAVFGEVFSGVRPTVITGTAGSPTTNSVTVSGNEVTSDGGSAILERGVVYSTSPGPTTDSTKVVTTGTTGSYNSEITGLSPGQTYYVRAFATNGSGTSYGGEISFATGVDQDPLFTDPSQNATLSDGAGGSKQLSFTGIPGRIYGIQRSTTLAADDWVQIDTVTTPPNGEVSFQDPSPPTGKAFYRIVYPPAGN